MSLPPATSAERKRASVLRRRADLSRADRAWLDAYDAERGRAPIVTRQAPAAPAPAPSAPAAPPVSMDDFELEDLSPLPAPPRVTHAGIDAGIGAGHAAEIVTASCPLGPDCPDCRAARGVPQCATTGRRQYPRMTKRQAEGICGMLLQGLEWFARWRGRDVRYDDADVARLADAVSEVVYRRFSVLSTYGDDVIGLVWVGSVLAGRAIRAPRIRALPAPAPPAPRAAPDRSVTHVTESATESVT